MFLIKIWLTYASVLRNTSAWVLLEKDITFDFLVLSLTIISQTSQVFTQTSKIFRDLLWTSTLCLTRAILVLNSATYWVQIGTWVTLFSSSSSSLTSNFTSVWTLTYSGRFTGESGSVSSLLLLSFSSSSFLTSELSSELSQASSSSSSLRNVVVADETCQ